MKDMIVFIAALFLSVIFMEQDAASIGPAGENAVKSIVLPAIEVELREGPGKDKVATYCNICHSPDYITMQPKFPADKWSAIVHKMIVVFGAPVGEDDSRTIINYLAEHYGPEQ
jgi:cytochrome c5